MPSISAHQADLDRATPLARRVTVRIHEAAVMSGLSLNKIDDLIKKGTLRSTKVGRARLINVKSLLDVLEGRTPLPPRKKYTYRDPARRAKQKK